MKPAGDEPAGGAAEPRGARRLAAPATLPDGSRDVLPVEAEELRAIELALGDVFGRFGYREVRTPVLELEEVVERAQEGGLRAAFRLFDDHGRVLVLRPDLTIPATRLIATRMVDHPGPVRVSYLSRAFQPPPPGRAVAAEQLQAGIELVGVEGPPADAEAVAVLVGALRAAGLGELRVGLGDVSLTAAVLDGAGLSREQRTGLEAALAARNLAEWRRRARAAAPPEPLGELLVELPGLRGGTELLARIGAAAPSAAEACDRLARTLRLAEAHGAGGVVMVDLGVLRDWTWYSGVVIEAYAPGAAAPVAMGGRYDGLAARFGTPRPAVGVAIALDLLHRALMHQGVGTLPPRPGVVLVGGLERELAAAIAARAAGVDVVAAPEDPRAGRELAEADGWRYVARRDGDGFLVYDRARGITATWGRLEDALASP